MIVHQSTYKRCSLTRELVVPCGGTYRGAHLWNILGVLEASAQAIGGVPLVTVKFIVTTVPVSLMSCHIGILRLNNILLTSGCHAPSIDAAFILERILPSFISKKRPSLWWCTSFRAPAGHAFSTAPSPSTQPQLSPWSLLHASVKTDYPHFFSLVSLIFLRTRVRASIPVPLPPLRTSLDSTTFPPPLSSPRALPLHLALLVTPLFTANYLFVIHRYGDQDQCSPEPAERGRGRDEDVCARRVRAAEK